MPEIGEFIPELVCMGVDLIICGVLYKAYSTTNNVLRDLNIAPKISIDDQLKRSIEMHPSSEICHGDNITIPYAVIRGEVAPLGKTVCSSYSSDLVTYFEFKYKKCLYVQVKGVIQKVVFTEHKRNMSRAGFWVDSERLMHQYTNHAPFCLNNAKVRYIE